MMKYTVEYVSKEELQMLDRIQIFCMVVRIFRKHALMNNEINAESQTRWSLITFV